MRINKYCSPFLQGLFEFTQLLMLDNLIYRRLSRELNMNCMIITQSQPNPLTWMTFDPCKEFFNILIHVSETKETIQTCQLKR